MEVVAAVLILLVIIALALGIELVFTWLLQIALAGVFGIHTPFWPLFALVLVISFFLGMLRPRQIEKK